MSERAYGEAWQEWASSGQEGAWEAVTGDGLSPAPQRALWVVLDLGETLVDETRNWGRWADHLGVPHLTFFGALGAVIAQRRPHTDVFSSFRPGFDLEHERAVMAAAGRSWHVTQDDLYPDALPVLAQLRASGYRLAVMANQPRAVLPFLDTLGVDRVAVSEGRGLHKPDPRFFRRITEELACPAERICYVGDRVDNDVLPAKEAGMTAVHLRRGPWGVVQADWPEAELADVQLTVLGELPAALESLWSHAT